MKKIFVIYLFLIPTLFSCNFNDEIFDYYNGCSEELLDFKKGSIEIQYKEYSYPINTLIAENEKEYQTGLMCRRSLPIKIDGMIFKYKKEQNKGFWMYKTYMPLTIVYFDKFGNSVGKSNMNPCTRDIYESKSEFELRCLEESLNYLPQESYFNVLELKSDYIYINELNSIGKDEKLKLIIKN